MDQKDTYLMIENESEGFYKEKGSKFLAFAYPVEDEDQVKEILSQLKKKYYDARHHCYAYILGVDGDSFRANDDGEPGHSAGDPILGQIKSNNLTNTLVVVVRYFGGTKLGVSGLVNAYKTSAAEALANSQIVEKLILSELTIQFEYPQMNQVMRIIKDFDLTILDQKLEMACEMTLGVRLSLEQNVKDSLLEHPGINILMPKG